MKKTLIIVRHAHTHDPVPGVPDHERKLTADGMRGARKAAEWLQEQGCKPDRIVASSAIRTQATANIISEILLNEQEKYESDVALYRASETDVVDFIHQHFTDENTVLLVGHNPTASQLVIRLGASNISYLPPASAIIFSFDIAEWSELNFHGGKLIDRYLPEEA